MKQCDLLQVRHRRSRDYSWGLRPIPEHPPRATLKGQMLWGYHTKNFWLPLEGVQLKKESDQRGSETVDVEDQEYEDSDGPEEGEEQ